MSCKQLFFLDTSQIQVPNIFNTTALVKLINSYHRIGLGNSHNKFDVLFLAYVGYDSFKLGVQIFLVMLMLVHDIQRKCTHTYIQYIT